MSYFKNYFYIIPNSYYAYINVNTVNAIQTDHKIYHDEQYTFQIIYIIMKVKPTATVYRVTIYTISSIFSKIGGFTSGIILLVNLLLINFVRDHYKSDVAKTMIEEGVDMTKEEKAKKIKQLLELTECSLTGENIMDLTRKGEQQDLINFDLHQ